MADEEKEAHQTPLNKDSRMLSAVSYIAALFVFPFGILLIPYLAPLLIYLFIKQDKFVRFNALQAFLLAVFFSIAFALLAITVIGLVVAVPALILYCLFCAWSALEAYRGRLPQAPFISEFAKMYL